MKSYKLNIPTSFSTDTMSKLLIHDIESKMKAKSVTCRSPSEFISVCNEALKEFVDETAKIMFKAMADTMEYQQDIDEAAAQQAGSK